MRDRIEKPSVLILRAWEGHCLAVYSSYAELKLGIDYWINDHAQHEADMLARGQKPKFRHTMFFVQFELDYSPEPETFDYAYIHPPEFDLVRKRGIKSGMDPDQFKVNGFHARENAGVNLIWAREREDRHLEDGMLATRGMGKRIRAINTFK